MQKDKVSIIMAIAISMFSLSTPNITASGKNIEQWQVLVSKSALNDEAIKVAFEDLQKTGIEFGIDFKPVQAGKKISGNTIIVGAPAGNEFTAGLIEKGIIKSGGVTDPQGFEIITTGIKNKKVMLVSGGSVLGDVYGLYWIRDRLRVFKTLPDINVKRVPELKIRYAGGGNKAALRDALRYGVTWVTLPFSVNQLVPWDAEPERTNNQKNREQASELIEYAHALHLKTLIYEDEFSYHPSLLAEFRARPTPVDPVFWDAIQAKYRRLFRVMPQLDGIRTRSGESTRIGGNFKALDLMHEGEGCDWSLDKRYRTFVQKMYNVIVGEFDKIYFHRTWVTNAYEQHSQAEVYESIFTDDVPVKNLYLSPYLSQTDRYFHQPYNPTFNLTPHNMVVLLATLDYHTKTSSVVFPSFPGQYYQAGLQTILAPGSSNLKGTMFDFPANEGWGTQSVSAYVASRLSLNPDENVRAIAKDFAAIHFGKAAADVMAEIYLLSPAAYKYGIYIEPVAYGDFNSLPHLRLNIFPVKGFPWIDNGKKHLEFLQQLYLRCKPWQHETIMYLDRGLQVADEMADKFQSVKPLFEDIQKAQEVENSLELTRMLIKTNNLYVKAFFAYFNYRDEPAPENKQRLSGFVSDLQESMTQFLKTPGCDYELPGMTQLVINVEQALDNLARAEKMLENAPDPEGVKQIIANEQIKHAKALEEHAKDAIKLLHWEGRVDGRDMLKITGSNLEVKHLRFDPIQEMRYKFFQSLPEHAVTVILRNIQSRSFRPFVLEQPSRENNFSTTIILSDSPCSGYSWWKFELYYIPKPPAEIGLEIPWLK